MQDVNHIIRELPIANWSETNNPIVQLPIEPNKNTDRDVDQLLKECSDLIIVGWEPYFAKKFYKISRDRVMILASQARNDYRTTPQKLFSYLVKRES